MQKKNAKKVFKSFIEVIISIFSAPHFGHLINSLFSFNEYALISESTALALTKSSFFTKSLIPPIALLYIGFASTILLSRTNTLIPSDSSLPLKIDASEEY